MEKIRILVVLSDGLVENVLTSLANAEKTLEVAVLNTDMEGVDAEVDTVVEHPVFTDREKVSWGPFQGTVTVLEPITAPKTLLDAVFSE